MQKYKRTVLHLERNSYTLNYRIRSTRQAQKSMWRL